MINRRLIIAGVSAMALSPGVAWACNGSGHPGPYGSTGATGATAVAGSTGSTGTSGVTSASARQTAIRRAHHHAHARKSATRR